jgi:enamine deaminase RidA (YjgF/YER057c/UK114 family)
MQTTTSSLGAALAMLLLSVPAVCVAQQASSVPATAGAAVKRDAKSRPASAPSPAAPLVNYLNPDTMMQSDAYSKVAVVDTPSRTAYFSGCIPVDKSYNVVGRDDLRAQVKESLQNLKLAMDAAGVTKNDIVKLSVTILYKDNRDTFTVSEELVSFFERDDPPATTINGSPFIIAEGILVQIEAIGVLPPAKSKS